MTDQNDGPPAACPWRALGDVAPLITAAQAYPVLERECLGALRRIRLWFRVFDPATPLVSPEARGAGLRTWRDLIETRLDAGVAVSVTLSDFDPVARPELHAGAWRAAAALRALEAKGLRLLVADHQARAGALVRAALWPVALWRVERLRRRLNRSGDGAAQLDALPGLQGSLALRNGRVAWRSLRTPPLKPCTHHQKIAVFDDARAVIGGLDVDARRWDDPRHSRPGAATWRDVSLFVDGPVAVDIADHVARLENAEARRLNRVSPGAHAARAAPASNETPVAAAPPRIRLVRTLSGATESVTGIAPRRRLREIERAHLEAIARAERLIYIETQFFRSRRIARALARRARRTSALRLILVLPAAPEDVAFDGSTSPDARHGEHLQARCVARLRRAFGERVAIVSPARPMPSDAVARADDRSALHGAQIIYVHSKVMIVDDRVAIVSSANLNGRSLRWDTEAGVVVEDQRHARDLRRRLIEPFAPASMVDEATALDTAQPALLRQARADAARPPRGRCGLLLPYDLAAAQRHGAAMPLAPDELV